MSIASPLRNWRLRRQALVCRELVELVTEYLQGALSPADHTRFERHIADCPNCTAYLEQLRTTLTVLGSIDEEVIPEKAREELLDAFRDWRGV